jgi:hypothetical protein
MAFTTPQGRTATSLSEINVTPLVDAADPISFHRQRRSCRRCDVQLPETGATGPIG